MTCILSSLVTFFQLVFAAILALAIGAPEPEPKAYMKTVPASYGGSYYPSGYSAYVPPVPAYGRYPMYYD